MARIARRRLIAGAGALVAGPLLARRAGAQAPAANPRVTITTDHGAFTAEIFADKAPITARNFLRYVDTRRYDGAQFYRALRNGWDPTTGFIEGGLPNHPERLLPPIAHEPTTQTGLKNVDGTLSLARFAPGTGRADFSICVGDAPSFDADPSKPGDNLGFAAFGRVTDGMDVVHAILALPTGGVARNPVMAGQILSPPVVIARMRRT
jgi:peptidyl-prolyl cis-trans isomerase A (cyclophilin A)